MKKAIDQAATWQNRLGPRGEARVRLEAERLNKKIYRSYYWLTRMLFHRGVRGCIRVSGFHTVGQRNMRSIRVVEHEVVLDNLPRAFDGLRILQLTDLHLDLVPGFEKVIVEKLESLSWDLAVITGDYRNFNTGDASPCMEALRPIVEELLERSQIQGIPPLATLGNHDDGDMTGDMEAMGLQVLLNESVSIEAEGARLWLAGIDDSADFQSYDIGRAIEGIPEGEAVILLSHAPDACKEAAAAGIDYMLCGHTHGGQICLPGGVPVLTRTGAPRKCVAGPWREGHLQGYTSRGTGACGAPYRFNCPPEIAIHTLRSVHDT